MRTQPTLDLNPRTQSNLTDFIRMFRRKWESVTSILNGRVGFGNGTDPDNVDLAWASATTPGSADTDFTVTHNLGRVPVGYIIVSRSAACDVYTGSVASTATEITLKASATGVDIKLWVF